MKFSPPNFSNRERRLIYEEIIKIAPGDGSQELADKTALDALINKYNGDLARAGREFAQGAVADAAEEAVAMRALTAKFQEQFRTKKATQEQLNQLKIDMPNVGLQFDINGDIEVVSFKRDKNNPVPTPTSASRLGPDGKPIIPNATQEKIEAAGSRLGQTIKSFIEALMPLIKSIQKIVNDIKRMIEEIVEDFKYDGSKLATEDKYVERQIKEGVFLDKHLVNTQRKLDSINDGLSALPGDGIAAKKAGLDQQIDTNQALVKDLNEKIPIAGTEEAAKLIKQRDTVRSEVRKLQAQKQGLEAKFAEKEKLEERKATILLAMGQSKSYGEAQGSTKSQADKNAEGRAQAAKQEEAAKAEKLQKAQTAAWDAYNGLQVVLSGTDSTQQESLRAQDINISMKAFNTAIKGLQDDAIKNILEEIGFYTAESSATSGIFESVELDNMGNERFKLVYKKPSLTIELNDTGKNE